MSVLNMLLTSVSMMWLNEEVTVQLPPQLPSLA